MGKKSKQGPKGGWSSDENEATVGLPSSSRRKKDRSEAEGVKASEDALVAEVKGVVVSQCQTYTVPASSDSMLLGFALHE